MFPAHAWDERVIAVRRLREQAGNIMAAGNKEDMKAGESWHLANVGYQGKTSELPKGVAGPPYHYRCRTTTVAYFEGLDDVGDKYQFFDGVETQKQKITYQLHDKDLGRELLLTEDRTEYISKHLPESKIKAAMRSIKRFGESSINPEQLIAESENGVVLMFRDNVVYNAYIPDSKDYFNRYSIGRMKKWADLLKSLLIRGGFTR